ncbi:MAG: hypothetical protein AB1467_00405 [Candidatus Diapherotrites archaeon]
MKEKSLAEVRFKMVKERHKKRFLQAVKEGMADKQVVSLCKLLFSLPEFFTASTCAGRIILLKTDEEESKREASFLKKWHRKVKLSEVLSAMKKPLNEPELWFKQEPFILHIGANSLHNANSLLSIARKAGIKRLGIMVAVEGKFLMELIGTQSMALPLKFKGKDLVEKDYLEFIVKKANQKLKKNYLQLKKFELLLKKELEWKI